MITDNIGIKLTAAAIAVLFSGSYMSSVVQAALDARIAEECSHTSKQDTLFTNADITTSAQDNSYTDTPGVTTYITTQIKKSPVSTVTSVKHSQTSPVTSVITEAAKTEEITVPVTVADTPVAPPVEETPAPVPVAPVAPGYSVPESTGVDQSYFDKCVFVGDSHIKGLSGYGIVKDSRVFAQNGLSLAHINEKIKASDVQAVNPENIYIMMGTNGVMWSDWNDMIQKYKSFTDSLVQALPQARIYILSIPPVTADRESKPDVASGKYLNSDIDGYNNKLLEMAKDNGWYYLDVNSALKDGNGYLGSSTDGVHMSKDLYSTFKNYILTHVVG